MATPIEQDVILDADGRPLFSALEYVQREIAKIQSAVSRIQRDSFKSAEDFGKTVAARARELQQVSSQMRTLVNARNTPGGGIADLNAERNLAKATRTATAFARELAVARNTTEAIDAKMASINRRIAERGRQGQFATLADTAALSKLEQAVVAVRRLDAEYVKLQARARQAGGDFSLQISQINAARSALTAAALNGRRTNLGPEVIGVTDAQAALAERIAMARRRETLAIQEGYRARREVALADVNQLRTINELEAARATNASRVTAIREQLRIVTAEERGILLQNLEIEKAIGVQIRRNMSERSQEARQEQGQNRRGPVGNILSPGYAGAALARTSIYGGAAMLAYGAFNAVQSGIQNVVDLEDELARLQAISNSTDIQMQSLTASILSVGASSRFSIVDLTKISQTLAQAGVTANQLEPVLRSVISLATASGSTPDEAVNLVTSAMGAFNLQASETARIADLMTEALNRTRLTVQQTGQAIQYVAATAYEENISLEQLLATIGSVAQAGVRSGSTIGTGFRQFLVGLMEPTERLTHQFELLGITAADVDVSVRGLPAVLDTLRDKGFGAAQAYAGLNTRAAAFYLTASQNVDVADQLALAFAHQSAAATANERAMNSLTAQWQRFKNLIGGSLARSLEGPMHDVQNFLTRINDLIQSANAGGAGARPAAANIKSFGDFGLTALFPQMALINSAYESLVRLTGGHQQAAGAAQAHAQSEEELATRLSNATDATAQQRSRIAELDTELRRLIIQKESLHDNETRSAAETATLSARFQGLSENLVVTGNRYDDLVAAMVRFRQEQLRLLGNDLVEEGATTAINREQARQRGNVALRRALTNPELMSQLSGPEREALGTLGQGRVNSQEYSRALGIIGDAVQRFAGSNLEISRSLHTIVQSGQAIVSNTATLHSISTAIGQNRAAQTPYGQQTTGAVRNIEALIQQLGSQTNGSTAKASLTRQANSILDSLEHSLRERTRNPRAAPADRQFIAQVLSQIPGLRQQVNASNAPTQAETRAGAAAEREANRQRLITQNDIDRIGRDVTGLALGSGVRSAREQNALHARGLTPATAESSSHSNGGLARDFPTGGMSPRDAELLATALRNAYRNAGIDAYVKFETGHGRNQGSGPHIHASVRRGTRLTGAGGQTDPAEAEAQFQSQLDQNELRLAQRGLASSLRTLTHASTKEAFDAAVANARAALNTVNEQLRTTAANEVARGGFGPNSPQAQTRMAQAQDQIDQNIAEFQQKLADNLVRSAEVQIRAISEAFDRATQPARAEQALADSRLSGLGYASLANRVPDYVQSLAERRAAQARENTDRSRLAAFGPQISSQQNVISSLVAQRDGGLLDTEHMQEVSDKIVQLTNNLDDLKTQRDALAESLGAGGLIPTTLGEGLHQAMQAFGEAHNVMQSFQEMLIMNVGGALETVHESLISMFTSILDGSRTALQAFGDFAKGMLDYMAQLAAQALATQIFKLILQVGANILAPGASATSGGGSDFLGLNSVGPGLGSFNGGAADREIGRAGGGEVTNGDVGRDSVRARLSRGEWVIRKRAVDSLGPKFMADLNQHGSKAVEQTKAMPEINVNPLQQMNVYVVAPEAKPQLTKNDILITFQDDVLNNGQTKKLIKYIAQGG